MLERFGVTEDTWRDGGKKDKNFLESESPLFVGRAVVALAGPVTHLQRATRAVFRDEDTDTTLPTMKAWN
jgi:hypothetical protein